MTGDKHILEAMLGKLLGFEDGAADVLDHLLSIESKDVRTTGSSLVGLSKFVSNSL